jgi:hypothetical protein
MLYETFNSLKEAHGEGYFTSRIDNGEYAAIKENKGDNNEYEFL